jgi:DNA-directed RNA polymerase specialized sigma24 family protein
MGGMNVLAIRKAAIKHAAKWNFPEEGEDFAQFACEAFLRGRKATMHLLWIDYLRALFGYSDDGLGGVKMWKRLDRDIEDDRITQLVTLPNYEELTERQRVCLFLIAFVGCDRAEVAQILGLSGGRISQIFHEIKDRLKETREGTT